MEPIWIVLISIGGVLLLYILLTFVISVVVLKMATTPTRHSIEEAIEVQKLETGLDFVDYNQNWRKQNFEIDGYHGKIRGELILQPTPSKKVAIVCHGHGWNRINSVKYATIFYNQGYNVVIYDHAYFGLSDGKFTTLGLYEKLDLSSVIDYVHQQFGKDIFLALHGESMGAVTVLCELGVRSDINLVIADCPFSNTMKYYRELYTQLTHLPSFPIVDFANAMSKRKFRYDFYKTNPIDCVKNSNVPICFIHGDKDDFIWPHHSQDMYAVANNENCELHLFKGAGHAHSILVDKDLYEKTICNFLQKIENL